MIVTNGVPVGTTTSSRYFVKANGRPARSISPSRMSPRMDRGRSKTRTIVYTNGTNAHNTSGGAYVTNISVSNSDKYSNVRHIIYT